MEVRRRVTGTIQKDSMPRERLVETQTALSTALVAILGVLVLGSGGCGQTAKTVTAPSADSVHSYFGSPFPAYQNSGTNIDHTSNQVSLSTAPFGSPLPAVGGKFAAAPTGFLRVTENFLGVPDSQFQPPLVAGQPATGAWIVEIPGAGALANLLTVNAISPVAVPATLAGPVAMAQNTACPDFPTTATFTYVSVPAVNTLGSISTADYGVVGINTLGSEVTFKAQPFLVGSLQQPISSVAGGCSDSFFGPITTSPINSVAQTSFDRIALGTSGLLIDSFSASGTLGAFGQNNTSSGIIGVALPSDPVALSSVLSARYNGFIYTPQSQITAVVPLSYDATVLASSFGDKTANSPACSGLEKSLSGNHGQGSKLIAALPSANSLFGGEFLVTHNSTTTNDPSGADGSENCDVVIDLGKQDPNNNGLFPKATVFIGSNYPPFNSNNPWLCMGLAQGNGLSCAVSFPAVAVVGQVQGRFVVFVGTSPQSTPPAQLPDAGGNLTPQPIGIYLFQK